MIVPLDINQYEIFNGGNIGCGLCDNNNLTKLNCEIIIKSKLDIQ